MAASAAALCLCLCLLFTATTNGSTVNTTVSGDENVTNKAEDNETSTQFDSTVVTPSYGSTEEPASPSYGGTEEPASPNYGGTEEPASPSYGSTEEPASPTLPAEPLPVHGRVLTPITDVGRLCPCDEHTGVCDVNCCCDAECGEEVALFTSCTVHTVSGNKQLCWRDVASYSLRTQVDGYAAVRSSVRTEMDSSVLCIHAQNRVDQFSHPSPTLPTDRNFDSLFKRFAGFSFSSEPSRAESSDTELQAPSGYQYGALMRTADGGTFLLPAPGVTAGCVDNNPAAFLKDRSHRCSRPVVVDQDCGVLPALSVDTYTNIQLLSGLGMDAAEVPVQVDSVVLQAVDGTQTELRAGDAETMKPVLLRRNLCVNAVLKVAYMIRYSPTGEILNVSASLVLGFVPEAVLILEQEFQLTFLQEDGEAAAVLRSGNPGYVVGLPLLSGIRTSEGIRRSMDPRDSLSVLHSAPDQDCLGGRHQRSPVLFGLDSVSGCTLRLEDAANCSHIHLALREVLRGPAPPQWVASFGNSPLDVPLDWVPIRSNFNPGEGQSCSVPLTLHLEVQWTKFGSLLNPQAQIVSVTEVVRTNGSSLVALSAGSGVLSVTTSVTFRDVSAAARPGYRAMPTINAKLPYDFFSPFV